MNGDENGQPPAAPAPMPAQIPTVFMQGVSIGVGELASGERALLIGPVLMAFPLSVDQRNAVAAALSSSGLLIVPPSAMPPAGGV